MSKVRGQKSKGKGQKLKVKSQREKFGITKILSKNADNEFVVLYLMKMNMIINF